MPAIWGDWHKNAGNRRVRIAGLKIDTTIREVRVQYLFWNTEVLPVLDIMDEGLQGHFLEVSANVQHTASCLVDSVPLSAGRYTLSVIILETEQDKVLCRHDNVAILNVRADCSSGAHSLVTAHWQQTAQHTPDIDSEIRLRQ